MFLIPQKGYRHCFTEPQRFEVVAAPLVFDARIARIRRRPGIVEPEHCVVKGFADAIEVNV